MSQETGTNTNNQLTVNSDTSKIFIGDNRHDNFAYAKDNSAGTDDITIPAGTLFGRISATGYVIPLESGASDGSQFPIGILREDKTILYGEDYDDEITLCVEGRVARAKVIFQGSDTMATVVSSRRLDDRIGSDTVGIKLVASTELTGYDND